MNDSLFTQWYNEGILSGDSHKKIISQRPAELFSLHWELKTLLYLAVLLLSTGLGILVYKNIDTIGHQAVLLFIGLICIGSFYYCFKNQKAFSSTKVESPNIAFDYLLLLGCLSFITFITYIQYQYNVFGNRYGLASFIPMVVLFFAAYYFDNIGILSLAITNLAAWLGITVTPIEILQNNDFNSSTIILTGLLLGLLLNVAAMFTLKQHIKKHFEFTYTNFGMHILFISCIAAMIHFEIFYLLWFMLLIGIGFYFYRKALLGRSFYLLLITAMYVYVGLSYVVLNMLGRMNGFDISAVYIALFYFIGSGIGLVLFLINTNKKIK